MGAFLSPCVLVFWMDAVEVRPNGSSVRALRVFFFFFLRNRGAGRSDQQRRQSVGVCAVLCGETFFRLGECEAWSFLSGCSCCWERWR